MASLIGHHSCIWIHYWRCLLCRSRRATRLHSHSHHSCHTPSCKFGESCSWNEDGNCRKSVASSDRSSVLMGCWCYHNLNHHSCWTCPVTYMCDSVPHWKTMINCSKSLHAFVLLLFSASSADGFRWKLIVISIVHHRCIFCFCIKLC